MIITCIVCWKQCVPGPRVEMKVIAGDETMADEMRDWGRCPHDKIRGEAGQAVAVCGINRMGQLVRAMHRGKSGLHRVG